MASEAYRDGSSSDRRSTVRRGRVLGSFATALAHRLPRGENWVSGRSQCPECGALIGARDNIPIVSWVVLRGRCRSCGERISSRYPLTELALGGAVCGARA